MKARGPQGHWGWKEAHHGLPALLRDPGLGLQEVPACASSWPQTPHHGRPFASRRAPARGWRSLLGHPRHRGLVPAGSSWCSLSRVRIALTGRRAPNEGSGSVTRAHVFQLPARPRRPSPPRRSINADRRRPRTACTACCRLPATGPSPPTGWASPRGGSAPSRSDGSWAAASRGRGCSHTG